MDVIGAMMVRNPTFQKSIRGHSIGGTDEGVGGSMESPQWVM